MPSIARAASGSPTPGTTATSTRPKRKNCDNRSVYRLDPQKDGSYSITQVVFDTTQPNGILVSQDQSTLYVAESSFTRGIARELRAYPIKEDGSLGPYKTLFTWGEDYRDIHRGIDGMCLDADGNIVATAGWEVAGAGPMIYVFSPTGRVLETHPVPAIRPTNCCFGGPDMTHAVRHQHAGAFLQGGDQPCGLGDVSLMAPPPAHPLDLRSAATADPRGFIYRVGRRACAIDRPE